MASRVCVRIRKGINHCSQKPMASGTVPGGTSAALATSTDISSVSDLISQLNNSVALCLAADQAVKPTTLRFQYDELWITHQTPPKWYPGNPRAAETTSMRYGTFDAA